MVLEGSAAPQSKIISAHNRRISQNQNEGGQPAQPKAPVHHRPHHADSSSDTVTTTESETSSSDDEVVSQVSLHMGFNPCKCCVCEDCDLRNHCMLIGFFEMLFWVSLIVLLVFYGLISMGSEAVVTTGEVKAPEPFHRGVRGSLVGTGAGGGGGGGEDKLVDPSLFEPPDKEEEEEGEGRGLDEENSTLPSTTHNYEKYLRGRMGDAVVVIQPNTREGQETWEENINKFLVGISVSFALMICLSMAAGANCFLGAYYKRTGHLLAHTVLAALTSLLLLVVGVFLFLLECYFQLLLIALIFLLYIYFAVCSYGLLTIIRAGFYDNFSFQGITYTYSTVLRANVTTERGADGNVNTLHPNEQ